MKIAGGKDQISPSGLAPGRPLSVRTGEILALTDQVEITDGARWIVAVATDGRRGWIPDGLCRVIGGRNVAVMPFGSRHGSADLVEVVRPAP